MPRYIDTDKITIPKGFFDDLNVPKLLEWLKSQPTADVQEVKHGEWEYIDGDVGYSQAKCSFCGEIAIFGDEENIALYCPNCGAKIDGDVK